VDNESFQTSSLSRPALRFPSLCCFASGTFVGFACTVVHARLSTIPQVLILSGCRRFIVIDLILFTRLSQKRQMGGVDYTHYTHCFVFWTIWARARESSRGCLLICTSNWLAARGRIYMMNLRVDWFSTINFLGVGFCAMLCRDTCGSGECSSRL
jgi:hypothetical protein